MRRPTWLPSGLSAAMGIAATVVAAALATLFRSELDEAEELDEGDPVDLARRYRELRRQLPRLNVVGGCCGTDHRHIREICRVWSAEVTRSVG